MAWSFSALKWSHTPLLNSIAAAALTRITEFRAQELANTAWSLAKLNMFHSKPLIYAISSAAIPTITEWRSQELANMAWAFARCQFHNQPLLAALSSAAIRHGKSLESRHAEMVVLALSCLEDLSLAWEFLNELITCGREVRSLALAGPLSACDRRGLRGCMIERQFLSVLAHCPDLGAPSCNTEAAHLAEVGAAAKADVLLVGLDNRRLNALSPRLMKSCGRIDHMVEAWQLGEADAQPPSRPGSRLAGASRPHEKEARLLAHVLAVAAPGDPGAVCSAIEGFGRESLSRPLGGSGGWARSAGQWLKVAGDEKADILAMAVRLVGSGGNFLEVGTYCGYSALRLALAANKDVRILSLEADPGVAVIARNILAYAGLAHVVNVCIGHSEEWLPHLVSSEQAPVFNLVFFDQRGSRYTDDILVLENSGALPPGAVVVADNVLKPGAPAFLWHVLFSGLYETQVVAVPEFSMPGVEDWMSISVKKANHNGEDADPVRVTPPLPAELRELEWEADRMRNRAERSPGVGFDAWADFVDRMRQCLAVHGIKPN